MEGSMQGLDDVEEYSQRLRAALGEDLSALILYGSRARGTGDAFSDTDLCVVVRHKGHDIQGKAREAVEGQSNYAVHITDEEEFRRALLAGDIFFKGEVLEKGMTLYDRSGFLSSIQQGLANAEPDFTAAERLHAERYANDVHALEYHLAAALERLKWAFADLTYQRLAQANVQPASVEQVPWLMRDDPELAAYAEDFEEAMRLNKAFQHRQIEYPFQEIKRLYGRLQQLKDESCATS